MKVSQFTGWGAKPPRRKDFLYKELQAEGVPACHALTLSIPSGSERNPLTTRQWGSPISLQWSSQCSQIQVKSLIMHQKIQKYPSGYSIISSLLFHGKFDLTAKKSLWMVNVCGDVATCWTQIIWGGYSIVKTHECDLSLVVKGLMEKEGSQSEGEIHLTPHLFYV